MSDDKTSPDGADTGARAPGLSTDNTDRAGRSAAEAGTTGGTGDGTPEEGGGAEGATDGARRRRRGTRGGRSRSRSSSTAETRAVDGDGAPPVTGDGSSVTGGAHATGPVGAPVSSAALVPHAPLVATTVPATVPGASADGTGPVPVPGPGQMEVPNSGAVIGNGATVVGMPAGGRPAVGEAAEGGTATGGQVPAAIGVPAGPPRPRVGDTRPAPALPPAPGRPTGSSAADDDGGDGRSRRRRRSKGGSRNGASPFDGAGATGAGATGGATDGAPAAGGGDGGRDRGGRPARRSAPRPVEAVLVGDPVVVDGDTAEARRGRERKGRAVGRYTMVVHAEPDATQIAVLEGRTLIEHYLSRPADDANQIDGNIYIGRVQNVLPGMEAAFVDIGTPKNAVLYRGDVRYDTDDVEAPAADGKGQPTRGKVPGPARNARIEQLLKGGQTVLCQVTKNPIGHKGARLTQEVSLPGRFVVLVANSDTYGISKRLDDTERKRLRRILDDIRPAGHGLIVRTAAEGASSDELRRDVARLLGQWERIEALASSSRAPALLYREPDMAVRVIREEFNRNYRAVILDDRDMFEEVRDYVASISPELADRVELSSDSDDPLPPFERYHVHEQIHKALDRKVWLPSGGSLIIERTEALTVIDVNTGKNVGTSNLEETVFRNNLEAADEIAHQLRLRDIGGIIVIDFIDMEIVANRAKVIATFRAALARDKTRTQAFEISELGLVEMTRKRVSEGLVESFSESCPTCGGRGLVFDQALMG